MNCARLIYYWRKRPLDFIDKCNLFSITLISIICNITRLPSRTIRHDGIVYSRPQRTCIHSSRNRKLCSRFVNNVLTYPYLPWGLFVCFRCMVPQNIFLLLSFTRHILRYKQIGFWRHFNLFWLNYKEYLKRTVSSWEMEGFTSQIWGLSKISKSRLYKVKKIRKHILSKGTVFP